MEREIPITDALSTTDVFETVPPDISESRLESLYPGVLDVLLADRSTGGNIVWATSDYEALGDGYGEHDQMTAASVVKDGVICPRVEKAKDAKKRRTRDRAEVFTPGWLVRYMIDEGDADWLEDNDAFSKPDVKVRLAKGRGWRAYVRETRLEITCGEAPYIVSRYDSVTGEPIRPCDRYGMLDRKLRVIRENSSEKEWAKAVEAAYKSVYGFELQGDSLLIARENMLAAYLDEHLIRRNTLPESDDVLEIARTISWNVVQMDGLTLRSVADSEIDAVSMDWVGNEPFTYRSMVDERK